MVFNAERLSVLLFFLFSTLMMGQNAMDELQPGRHQNLLFEELATTWDEGSPLGNGMLGALIWEKEGKLRFSLDRADLWDLRPTANLDHKNWNFIYFEYNCEHYDWVTGSKKKYSTYIKNLKSRTI